MVLRKYLQGALIESIEQVENDRIVKWQFPIKSRLRPYQATLIIEIMGNK